jgi:hypothetical protein
MGRPPKFGGYIGEDAGDSEGVSSRRPAIATRPESGTPDPLVLRRREAASKDVPGGANKAENWTILRDAKLRFALRMRRVEEEAAKS